WNWRYGMIGWDGARTHWYDVIAALDPRAGATGRVLARLEWRGTEHAGWVPDFAAGFQPNDLIAAVEGRAAIGMFADSAGTHYALVVNSDSLQAHSIALTFSGARDLARLSDDGAAWFAVSSTAATAGPRVSLDPGP